MIEKESQENIEDLEQFDNLEKNFHKVVSDLVTDQSLASFRVEYEKLHKSLVLSHDDNLVLIEKCRQLNNDILANANKVSSVMQLSQNDQRTITGLKHEFEKAWSLVEISQDKEQKSKDVIDNLKAEVTKLSHLVEQGSTLAFTQENSLHETEIQISQLKVDIRNQGMQIETMKQEIERIRGSSSQLAESKEKLAIDFSALTNESGEIKTEENALNESVEKVHNDLNAIKQLLKDSQELIAANVQELAAKKDFNAILKDRGEVFLSNHKVECEDLKTITSEVAAKRKQLEDEIKQTAKFKNDVEKAKKINFSKSEEIQSYKAELNKVLEENKEIQQQLLDQRNILAQINEEKKNNRQRVAQLQTETFLRTAELSSSHSNIGMLRRQIEKIRKDSHNLTSEKIEEVHETQFVESQNGILLNQAIDIKTDTHNLRGDVITVQNEIEEYQIRTSAARSNHYQLSDEVRQREDLLDEKTKFLAEMYSDIKHQSSITDSLKNDRDLTHRLLQKAAADNQKLVEETSQMALDIQRLKGEIRENDQLCLSTHITQKELADSLIVLSKEKDKLVVQVQEKENRNTELRNHIQKSRYLYSQTELQNMKQTQVINDLKSMQYSLNESVTKKTVEISYIRETIYLLKGELTVGSLAFKTIIEKINQLNSDLLREVNRKRLLLESVKHSKALWKESIQLTKALLLEQGKCHALEEELERPMNIHRWRFLEGTNPELLQLIKMSMELRDRLMELIYQLQRRKEQQKTVSQQLEKEGKHLKFSYGGDIQEDMVFLTETMHSKTNQLNVIQTQVITQQSQVEEQKEIVMNLREMLREEKSEYYDVKKKTETIRASTVKGQRDSKEEPPKSNEARFIGGGFSVQRSPTSLDKARLVGAKSAFVSPHIIAPGRAKTAMKKKLPSGWNPTRQQLAPFLPTVSGPQ